MISRLTLKNWRNYHDLDVVLTEGTTFVVASNGVGKTSLVEAARWALFNVTPVGGASAIRAGEEIATAAVELMMPGARRMRVTRTLAKKTRAALGSAEVTIDAVQVSSDALGQFLLEAYKAEPSFLANLTMPTAHPQDGVPSKLGLEDHLGQYYGVTGLRRAIDRLNSDLKDTEARIRQVKAANATSVDVMARLQDAVDLADLRVRETTQQHQMLQQRWERAKEQQWYAAAIAKWQEEWTAWSGKSNELASRLSEELGRVVAAADFDAALVGQKTSLQRQLEATRIEIGVNRGRQQAIRANQSRLDSSEYDCPVCRRPLDDDTVLHAHSANDAELFEIDRQLQSLQVSEDAHGEAMERLKRLETDHGRLRRPVERPAALTAGSEEEASADDLKVQVAQALGFLVESRAAYLDSKRSLDDARAADQAMHELQELFLREGSIRVAIATTESTLSELLNETIRPLATEVDLRWKALFPGRGDLTTTADGGISRTVNGHPLPYDSFSTGEGMGATILMRLLIAQMATKADFCWFDEPLEHLDPDVRRRVANLLARVTTTGGPLRQVVVTTYEEPLARQLEARDPLNVKLIDVRQPG